jgi:glycosyltransferase involved in cell wall biosynthesis
LDVDSDRDVELAANLRVNYCHRHVYHSVSFSLFRVLPAYIRWADLVHLTAVYSFPTIPTLLACRVFAKQVVWSPRGALQRWEGSTRTTLKAVWERVCWVSASKRLILHVTSEEEAKESLRRFPAVEAAIIPNGVEIPDSLSPTNGNGTLRLLYLGRLHPKKGVENLLAACKLLNDESVITWSLTLAGPGDPAYIQTLMRTIQEYKLSDRVKMVGEVRGEMKQKLFDNSDLTAVPSYTENFGMVVAESLAHGVPVIASKGTPWRRVEEIGCGLWVENDSETLAKAIEQISLMPLQEMGRRGREWMTKDFSWDERSKEMVEVYFKLLKHPS